MMHSRRGRQPLFWLQKLPMRMPMPTAHISNDSGRPITTSGGSPSRPRSISAIRRGIKEAGRSMANMHRKMIGRMMRGGREIGRIGTAEQFFHCVPSALVHLFLRIIIVKDTRRTVTVKVKRHPDHSHASAGLPAFMQALRFHAACLKIIDTVNVPSCVIADAKTIYKCFVVYVLTPDLFQFVIVEFFMCIADKNNRFLCS